MSASTSATSFSVIQVSKVEQTLPWYAIRTKSNCETPVARLLEAKGYEVFFPSFRVRRRWSDRMVDATAALFPGYLFCRFDVTRKVPVVSTPGLVSLVGFGHEPVPVPESEIEAVKALLGSGLGVEVCSYLHEGQRVHITQGALQHVEGILIRKKNAYKFVVSVPLLQRSVFIEIDPQWIAAV